MTQKSRKNTKNTQTEKDLRSKKRKASHRKGLYAEYFACLLLWLRGYKILKHRYKTPVTEIDILAIKKQKDKYDTKSHTVVVCEVKYRKMERDAIFSLAPRQQ